MEEEGLFDGYYIDVYPDDEKPYSSDIMM